jgi:methionine-S-sulfoxide reductase
MTKTALLRETLRQDTAIFAGGCFWCVEHDLRAIPGVTNVVSGYSGGDKPNPTYAEVCSETTGHREAVEVTYNVDMVSYKKLCQFFLDHIDPTDSGGQFFDRGESYKTAIFYADEEEKTIAESLLAELNASGLFDRKVAVDILPKKPFYPAEEYHQNYAEKNPAHYGAYAAGSGRVQFVVQTCAVRDEKKIQWKD